MQSRAEPAQQAAAAGKGRPGEPKLLAFPQSYLPWEAQTGLAFLWLVCPDLSQLFGAEGI